MGVADFGVTGSGPGSSDYRYNTSSFEGRAAVRSMSMSATSGSTTTHVAAFELNAVVVFQLGGTNYSYWIQNGLHVDTSSDRFTIGGAYVWNFSSPSARLSLSEVRGNSSSVLLTDTYYFIPGCGSFAGQCSTLTFPGNLTGRILLSICGAYPCVDYEYDIGSGWITYDVVSFLHMGAATPLGFVVDGTQYAPIGVPVYYDAEWDWVAAGGGSSGRDDGSNMVLSLDYWDGQAYQPVPSAWNFGGDTGETSFNVTERLNDPGPGGAPAGVVTSGPGTLGVLYNASSIGFLNVTAPIPAPGILEIDGSPMEFPGSSGNLTVVAGTYTITLENYSNATRSVTVAPGQESSLVLAGAGRTVFEESGLAQGTSWGLTIDGVARSAGGPAILFNLPNGSFPIRYAAVPGYARNASDPTELAVPVVSPVSVGWTPFTFEVPVTETGLPSATSWWVNASGAVVRGTGTTIDVSAPNGTTPYTVGASYAFVANPAQGALTVFEGTVSPLAVQFSYRPGYITGSVTPADAQLTIDAVVEPVASGIFNVSVVPGEYSVVASAPGYTNLTLPVNVTAGNATTAEIALNLTPISPAPAASPAPGVNWGIVGIATAGVVVIGASVVLYFRRSRSG